MKRSLPLFLAVFIIALGFGIAAIYQASLLGAENPKQYAPPITLEQIRAAALSLHPAKHWRSLGRGRIRCDLCPTRCVLWPGRRGACRVRVNIDGELFSLVYSRLVAGNNDPIEKKPLFHVFPGTFALSIATAGCNLGCIFCQNWEISQADPEKKRYDGGPSFSVVTPEQVVQLARQYGADSIAFTYTEPSIFYEYMLDTAKLAKAGGLKTLSITCGYINPAPLRELAPYLDAANVDLKGFSEEFYQTYCGASLQPVLDTLKLMKKLGIFVEITNLVIPGANDSDEMIRGLCKWVKENMGEETPVHFSRYHPDYKLRRAATPAATLQRARNIALEVGLKYVYIGNIYLPGGETTFCPGCKRKIIERIGFSVKSINVRGGKCGFCGEEIPGVWK